MDAMLMNHGYSGEGLRVNKEWNIDTTRLFKLSKQYDKLL